MNNPATPQKKPHLEEFPSTLSAETYPEIRRRLFEAFGWTHWTKSATCGWIDGVPPGGTPPLQGHRGDLTTWPNPLHNAWGIEALETAMVERGWELEVEHNSDHTTVRIWVDSACHGPVQILHHDESSPALRRRSALVQAALQAVQATRQEVPQP